MLRDANGNIHILSDTQCSCGLYETSFHGHQGRVNAISWSSDNQRFAPASDEGTIQTWSGSNGLHVQTYPDPYKAKDTAVAWSPDGQFLLLGDDTGRLMLWQAA